MKCKIRVLAALVFYKLLYPSIGLVSSSMASSSTRFFLNDGVCRVPLFAETDVSETNFLFESLLNQIDRCGCHLDWRKRENYSINYTDTRQIAGPLILVATGGPTQEEQDSFQIIPEHQKIILLHPSDEELRQLNSSIYGNVSLAIRNYFHSDMDDGTIDYLLVSEATKVSKGPKHLWMPLGLANLKVLPKALRHDFRGRPFLWAWAGSTGSKPERTEMLEALKTHPLAERILGLGALHAFNSYAGRPVVSQGSMNVWEYSILMQKTQFVPVPAGISAEQFRIWEAFEAGEVLGYIRTYSDILCKSPRKHLLPYEDLARLWGLSCDMHFNYEFICLIKSL